MYVRGPGINAGTVISQIGGNVDVAPTFLELAGYAGPTVMDGTSIVPLLSTASADAQLLARRQAWSRDAFLVEFTGLSACKDGKRCNDAGNNTYRGLRIYNSSANLAYVQYTEAADWHYETPYHEELYDMQKDPYQLQNIITTEKGKAVAAELQPRLERAWVCKGKECADV